MSASQRERVYQPFRKQEAHHAQYAFQAAYLGLLKAHEVEYYDRYTWD